MARRIEPLLASAVFALSLHVVVLSIQVQSQVPVLAIDTGGGQVISVRAVGVGSTEALTRSSASVSRNASQTEPGEPRPAESTQPAESDAIPIAAPPLPFRGERILVAVDEEYFPRQLLDIGPNPQSPVRIDYPSSSDIGYSRVGEFSLFIDQAGRVVRFRAEGRRLPAPMEEAARAAFMGADFSPGLIDGLPVRSRIRIEVTFEVGVAAGH